MSLIHLETLDSKRQEIFKLLSAFRDDGYLVGGTALSLQICHRKSYDFDIFVKKQIDVSFLRRIKKVFKQVVFTLNTPDQVDFSVTGGIKVTFFLVEHQNLFPLVTTDGIFLADSRDVAANKVYTIGRRATWRDYVDLYFLLKLEVATLQQIIIWGKKKFSGEFNEAQFLEQMVYFKDLEIVQTEYLHETPTPDQIKNFLEEKVREYLKKTD